MYYHRYSSIETELHYLRYYPVLEGLCRHYLVYCRDLRGNDLTVLSGAMLAGIPAGLQQL